MPFEPDFPSPFQAFFHGHLQCAVIDAHGQPANTIISMQDDWHMRVEWQVHGMLVGSIGGTWQIRAYLESIGPGNEVVLVNRNVPMTGQNNYSETFIIGPNVPNVEGPYKIVVVLTSTNLLGLPAPFAAYEEVPMLQFFPGPSL